MPEIQSRCGASTDDTCGRGAGWGGLGQGLMQVGIAGLHVHPGAALLPNPGCPVRTGAAPMDHTIVLICGKTVMVPASVCVRGGGVFARCSGPRWGC